MFDPVSAKLVPRDQVAQRPLRHLYAVPEGPVPDALAAAEGAALGKRRTELAGARGRRQRREWLWANSSNERQRKCGRTATGEIVGLSRRGDRASWVGLQTCGSVWTCPVCSAVVLGRRGDELREAVETWASRGGAIALVTLTMRHGPADTLASCWDAQSDAWAAAAGRSRGARRALDELGAEGWVRRVEVTHGPNGWHVHVHALIFLAGGTTAAAVAELGAAMFGAWAARLARVGLTPVADRGGLHAKLLDLDQAVEEVAGYVAKGLYTADSAALELAGSGKRGRGENVTPWGLLDSAAAGDRRARALWAEWEAGSHGRRAITWSKGMRRTLGLGEDLDDQELVDESTGVDDVSELVAVWPSSDWAELRAAAEDLLDVVEGARPDWAGAAVFGYCVENGLPLPRTPGELEAVERRPPGPG